MTQENFDQYSRTSSISQLLSNPAGSGDCRDRMLHNDAGQDTPRSGLADVPDRGSGADHLVVSDIISAYNTASSAKGFTARSSSLATAAPTRVMYRGTLAFDEGFQSIVTINHTSCPGLSNPRPRLVLASMASLHVGCAARSACQSLEPGTNPGKA